MINSTQDMIQQEIAANLSGKAAREHCESRNLVIFYRGRDFVFSFWAPEPISGASREQFTSFWAL